MSERTGMISQVTDEVLYTGLVDLQSFAGKMILVFT